MTQNGSEADYLINNEVIAYMYVCYVCDVCDLDELKNVFICIIQ